jgi:hypothetical protein
MSAFIVSDLHIDYLVQAAITYGADYVDVFILGTIRAGYHRADALGRALLAANYDSVNDRYGRDDIPPDYRFTPPAFHGLAVTPVQTLKVIDCYEYQACQSPGYFAGDVHDFCNRLRRCAITHLPGYDEAQWEIKAGTSTAADPQLADEQRRLRTGIKPPFADQSQEEDPKMIATYLFGNTPEDAFDDGELLAGFDAEALSGDDDATDRAKALYAALDADPGDEEYRLGLLPDGRWALVGLLVADHDFAIEASITS